MFHYVSKTKVLVYSRQCVSIEALQIFVWRYIRIIRIIFKSIQKMLKKTWDGIKSIVTLKSKDKTTPNSKIKMVNGNIITNKNSIAEIFNDFFLLMLVQVLCLEYRKLIWSRRMLITIILFMEFLSKAICQFTWTLLEC